MKLGEIVIRFDSKKSVDAQIREQLKPIADAAWAKHPNNPINRKQ